jgi:hypothetical protein
MCWQAIPAILGAVDSKRVADARDTALAQGLARQGVFQREATARVGKNVAQLTPANPNADRQAAQADFMAALQKAQLTSGGSGLSPVGGASRRFAEDVGQARTAAGTEAAGVVGDTAAIDAPAIQRAREDQAAAATASDLGLITNRARGQDFLTQLRVSMMQPNPALAAFGAAAGAYGTAKAGRVKKPPIDTPIPLSPGGNYSYAIPGG